MHVSKAPFAACVRSVGKTQRDMLPDHRGRDNVEQGLVIGNRLVVQGKTAAERPLVAVPVVHRQAVDIDVLPAEAKAVSSTELASPRR